MDKKYYSAKHKRTSRARRHNPKSKNEGTSFILRLNICIGLAIAILGAVHFNENIRTMAKRFLTVNTSVETVKETAGSIKEFVIDAKSVSFLNNEDFVPDDNAREIIEKAEENSYYNIQKKLQTPNETWLKPVKGGVITDVFGSRANPVTGKNENHKGLDIGVPLESEARAVKSGTISDLGNSQSYGKWIKYHTYDGYDILYAHLTDFAADKGSEVKQGDVIAYTGSTGNSTGPHLHYEIMLDGEYIDPYEYYEKGI